MWRVSSRFFSSSMANDPDQQLAFVEAELAAYRIENDRLARELVLSRRVLDTLPFTGPNSPIEPLVKPARMPRTLCNGDDILFSMDRCESGEKLVHVAGWAFSPRIDCGEAHLSLLLEGPDETFIVHPRRTLRPDVAAAYAQTDLGTVLPVDSPARARLEQCGFAGLITRAGLVSGRPYKVAIQIDGPEFSVRKSTTAVLHG
jgi:hypothetical protein